MLLLVSPTLALRVHLLLDDNPVQSLDVGFQFLTLPDKHLVGVCALPMELGCESYDGSVFGVQLLFEFIVLELKVSHLPIVGSLQEELVLEMLCLHLKGLDPLLSSLVEARGTRQVLYILF